MKVLVTGGAGFIGREIVKQLLEKQLEVLVLDDYSNSSKENIAEFVGQKNFLGAVEGKIENASLVNTIFSKNKFDLVVHAAAQINVQESIDNPKKSFDSNIIGTNVLLEESRKHDTKFVCVSTCMVYDLAGKKPIDELHPLNPLSPYAASKLASEALVGSYNNSYGLKTVILRPFNTYGPFQKSNMEGGVVSIFIKNSLGGRPLQVFGSGEQTRDLLFVEDCAEFILKAASSKNAVGEVFNAGSGVDISINELALLIGGGKSKIQHVVHHHSQAEIMKLVCNPNKAREKLAWQPRTSLEDGIKKTEKWLRKSSK